MPPLLQEPPQVVVGKLAPSLRARGCRLSEAAVLLEGSVGAERAAFAEGTRQGEGGGGTKNWSE